MSALLGADTRSVDAIADRLGAHSHDVANLRSIAQRALAEMRNAWSGADFESIAARWEQEAGPRLVDVSTALAAMAETLRFHAAEQRRVSGTGGRAETPLGHGVPVVTSVTPGAVQIPTIEELDPDDLDVSLQGLLAKAPEDVDKVKDNVKVNITAGEVSGEASLVSAEGGNDSAVYEVAAGRAEAGADYSVDVDAHGDLVASAGVSAAAYAGYAAGRVQAGNDRVRVGADAKVLVGAEVGADASASIGRRGAAVQLGADAFAGAKAEVAAGGTLAGVTASAGAEISYGIGAHANLDADLGATKVGVAMDLGVTLGVGTGGKFEVSVNPQEVLAEVGHGVDAVGVVVGDAAEDLSDAAEDLGEGVGAARDQMANLLHW